MKNNGGKKEILKQANNETKNKHRQVVNRQVNETGRQRKEGRKASKNENKNEGSLPLAGHVLPALPPQKKQKQKGSLGFVGHVLPALHAPNEIEGVTLERGVQCICDLIKA